MSKFDLIEVSLSESAGNTGKPSNWNAWDDYSCNKGMDAPPMVPRGATRCLGSKPNRFLLDTHVVRPGEDFPER